MSAKAGIQQGFVEAPDSCMHGNDEMTGCDSIENRVVLTANVAAPDWAEVRLSRESEIV
jgi:hypothetical protein